MSDFEEIISVHCVRLYSLCLFIENRKNKDTVLNRRFLGRLNLESTWMEETLDAAGARNSDKWFSFREGVSALKLFSSVCYDVLHVEKSFPHYNLIVHNNSFETDIIKVMNDLYEGLFRSSTFLVKKSKKCGLHQANLIVNIDDFIDINITSKLEKDRRLRHIQNPGKSLIYLSTEFINLKPEMYLFNNLSNLKKSEYKNYIPDCVSEEKLRLVLVRFHNLQSLYDTYLSESDIENVDSRLKVLRGHISFIYHMLKSATDFSHYYERHIVPRTTSLFFQSLLPIPVDRFLEITINFFMYYFIEYFNGAIELCKEVIDSYAEIGEKQILIPAYRGFHVRPSTLVSKIVNYYGGKVKMIVNDLEYDPSTPLELFRVNEEINAIKRAALFDLIQKEHAENIQFKDLLPELENRGVVVIYDDKYDSSQIKFCETNQEYLKYAFTFLLASGKIDIKMDISAKFIGDMRSLEDIELLAKNGYGEDKFGNNIPLPKKLSYLKR